MQTLYFYAPFSDTDTASTSHVANASVLSLLGMESPTGALYTGLYGTSAHRKAFPYIDAIYKKQGQRCCAISVEFDFDVYPLCYTGIEEREGIVDILVGQSIVLNTLRLRPDLKSQIKSQWQSLMMANGEPITPALPKPITQTHLVDELLVHYPQTALFIYQVASPVGTLSVASVYNTSPTSVTPLLDIDGQVTLAK